MFGHGRLVASAAQRGYIPPFFSRLDTCGFLNCDSGDAQKDSATPGNSSAQPENPPTEQQPLLAGPVEAEPSLEANPSPESEIVDTGSERQVPA
jgi:hypothetical protein